MRKVYPYHGVIIVSNYIKSKLKIGAQPLGHALHGILERKRQNSFQCQVTNTNGLRASLAVGFDIFLIFVHCISNYDCGYETSICSKKI